LERSLVRDLLGPFLLILSGTIEVLVTHREYLGDLNIWRFPKIGVLQIIQN